MNGKTIRVATPSDLPAMLDMIVHSRTLMRAAGNTVQWPEGYPCADDLSHDIVAGHCHIIEEAGRIVGTFSLVPGNEPTYSFIEGGQWLDDTTPYSTIHRLACAQGVHGIGRTCLEWCNRHADNLRMDTHETNATVRHLVEQDGFTYCGIVYMNDGTPRLAYQKLLYPMVRPSLKAYVEESILPCYDRFDTAHRRDHVLRVMAQSMELAGHYPELNKDMVYAIAACHDLGLCEGREQHHLVSGRLVRQDITLKQWFSDDEIEAIAQAVEDHRASADREPRSLYGRIVAEADRDIEPEGIVLRTVQYGLSHYPQLDREGHWQRTLEHLHEKYAPGGYLKFYIPQSRNAAQLQRLHALIADKERLRHLFDTLYNRLNGTSRPTPSDTLTHPTTPQP